MTKNAGILIGFLFLLGCSAPDNSNRDAIRRVVLQQRESVTNSWVILPTKTKSFSIIRLDRALSQINADDCPTDFRLAWNDYVFAVHKRLAIHGSAGLLESAAGALAFEFGGRALLADGVKKQSSAQDELSEADREIIATVQQVKRIAIKYDAE
jgi:hypothetical protein